MKKIKSHKSGQRAKRNGLQKAAKNNSPVNGTTLRETFLHFIEYHPAKRFSKNLRSMLLEFLMFEGAIEAIYLNDLLYDLEGLFQLLDVIESEEESRSIKE